MRRIILSGFITYTADSGGDIALTGGNVGKLKGTPRGRSNPTMDSESEWMYERQKLYDLRQGHPE